MIAKKKLGSDVECNRQKTYKYFVIKEMYGNKSTIFASRMK